MFGIAPSELMLLAVVALVVVGPKDLPRLMRTAGFWAGRARALTQQLRTGIDQVIRESELGEVEKRWKADNDRVMREHVALPPPAREMAGAAAPSSPSQLEPVDKP